MDILTMAMCKPKVIDLDNYTASDGDEISAYLLDAVMKGGDEYSFEIDTGFLGQFATNRAIVAHFSIGSSKVITQTVTTVVEAETVTGFTLDCVADMGITQNRLTAFFTRTGNTGTQDTVRLIVKVSEV